MKKCLLLIPRMGSGGAERVMATIANNLCKEHDVEIITMTDAESFYALDEGVEITGLGQNVNRKNKITLLFSTAIGGIKTFFKLKKKIKKEKPNVVLSFLQSANMMSILVKGCGKNFVLSFPNVATQVKEDSSTDFLKNIFIIKRTLSFAKAKR